MNDVITDFKVGIRKYFFLCGACRFCVAKSFDGKPALCKALIFAQGNACKARAQKLKAFCVKAADAYAPAGNIFDFQKVRRGGNVDIVFAHEPDEISRLNLVFAENDNGTARRYIGADVLNERAVISRRRCGFAAFKGVNPRNPLSVL